VQGKVMIKGDKPTVCEEGYAFFRDEANNRWVSGRTDPDGTITAEGVVPGTYTVQAGCRGYANAKDKLDPIVLKDQDLVGLVWEVEAGATIKGKVLTKRGEPIADAEVNARTTGGGLRDQQRWFNETSKVDGTYELEGLRAGTYLVEPQTSKAVAPRDGFKIDAPAGKVVEKDLVLDDGGKIEGVVVDEQGKRGARGDRRSRRAGRRRCRADGEATARRDRGLGSRGALVSADGTARRRGVRAARRAREDRSETRTGRVARGPPCGDRDAQLVDAARR